MKGDNKERYWGGKQWTT